ncbi:AraC family transcriptional regulator [Niallia sp. JL1B1071]|uniref:AraC family transcriptional regulator n=1 Tax=Niallia tiangongensis TaxID=3237105 RepID=UPI0037DC6218
MGKLEVKENKRLVLKNVIIKELRNIQMDHLDSEIQKFLNYIKVLNIQTYGPLITKSHGTNIHEDGSITFDYDVMLQAHDYHLHKERFKTNHLHTCDNCIYIRFEGKADHLNFAHTKLDLYLYENDLETDGSIYNIYIANEPEHTIIDIFRPVIKNENL